MLSRLRKNKDRLHHHDPAVRRQAVEALAAQKAQALQSELSALATSDPDNGVRAACIAQLNDPQMLAALLDAPAVAQLAAKRIAAVLLADGSQSPLLSHPLVLPKLPVAIALPLVEQIDDDAMLIEICLGNRGELRAATLARISSTNALSQLERHSRDHDKTLNRHARSALERIRASRRAANDALARVKELLDALERNQPGSPQRRNTIHRELQTTWASLLTQQEPLRAAGEILEDIASMEQRIADLPPAEPIAAAKPSAATDQPTDQPAGPSPIPDLVEQLAALQQAMAGGGALAPITSQRQALTEAWLHAAGQQQPTSAQYQVFESVSQAYAQYAASVGHAEALRTPEFQALPQPLPAEADALRDIWRELGPRRKALKQLQAQIAKVRWPDWAKPEASYRTLQQQAAQLAGDLARLVEHETRITADLKTLITVLASEVEAGETNKAANTLANARRLSRALPPRSAEDLLGMLNSEAAKFAELRDWQTFATSPKRQALCEKIKEIAERPLEPRDQADRIKQLRSEWNQLGPPTKQNERKLADEFNRLAETAFEPCRSYFAEQAEVRKSNLEQRGLICKQLHSYLESTHWQSADIKAAEQILRAARSEWRRFHPVDRNPGKKLETEFEALQAQLHQGIKDAWNANLQIKQGIVREAEELVEQDTPIEDKIDRAKTLQQRWKQVGATPRKPDQLLWQAFRQACDAVFALRDATREQADQALQQALQQTSSLIAEIRASVDAATTSDAQRSFIRDARSRFAQLPQIPERAFREAQRDFDSLMGRYSKLLEQRAASERLDQLRQLQAWDSSATDFERLRAAGAGQSYAAPAACFEDRLANTGTPPPLELLQEHAIAAELLAGLESPPSNQALRLKLRVDQLNAGMGKNPETPDPLKLAQAWCALGPKCWDADDSELHDECSVLRERLFQALEKLLVA